MEGKWKSKARTEKEAGSKLNFPSLAPKRIPIYQKMETEHIKTEIETPAIPPPSGRRKGLSRVLNWKIIAILVVATFGLIALQSTRGTSRSAAEPESFITVPVIKVGR